MYDFVSGLIAMGDIVAALFFLRFWSRSRDSLFASFAAAFCLLALVQALLVVTDGMREEHSWIYLIRLAAFLIIIAAVVGKNRRPRRED